MIKKYIIERRSWILLFLVLQALTSLIAYVDPTIPLLPVLYIVFLSMLIFVFFLFIRYQRETRFYKAMENWDNSLDITNMEEAKAPFERIIEEALKNQTNQLKQSASHNQVAMEQEKDDLLSWIHEVKTPLTAMHLMFDRLDNGTIKSQLEYEWLRIHHLLDQQLHEKRLAFIENDLYIEKTNLKEVVFKEIKELQAWCIQKGSGFEIDLKNTEVFSDAKWLAFIMRQLLTNAVKYSGATDILIKSFEEEGHTKLVIKDFGRGIDPKDLPRIFDKGFTSTNHHEDSAATGMGLYLSKKIADALLIQIDVDSRVDEGTTFILTFPKNNEFTRITGV